MPFKVKLVSKDAKLPKRAYNSAGYDLFAAKRVWLRPHEVTPVPLGIAAEFPQDHVAVLKDRSSMGKGGITVLAGVIDADYRGEWVVLLYNTNEYPCEVELGSKVTQALIVPFAALDVEQVDELSDTSRGDGAWGSSGK
jgi:dUTP pyrophosphatase